MKYLLFLNRFNLDINKLKNKIILLDKSSLFLDEGKNIIVETKLNIEKLSGFQEISKLVVLFNDWKDFSFKTIKEDCLKLCKDKEIKNYFIETHFHNKVPISARSIYKHINPYLKYEGVLFQENSSLIYIEFKKIDSKLNYRISYSNSLNNSNILKIDMSKFIAVLENPNLVSEVSDFLRLCWIFKIQLHIITKDKINFEKILKKAKEETKGIEYDKFKLIISDSLPKDYLLVGFSKHSDKNEKDMKNLILKDKKIALIFGDDKFGLSQETRDKLDYCFRLTPEGKKPLRASHALSYILGFYTAYNLD